MTDQDNALALIQNVLDDISLPRWQHDALSQAADAITAMQPTQQRCAECDCDGGECTWIASGNVTAACHDCERPYGHEHGFPDLIIPLSTWERISPSKDDGGLLCPSCICARLHKEGIKCSGAFMSGPIRSIDQDTMYALRWTENLRRTLERIEGDTND